MCTDDRGPTEADLRLLRTAVDLAHRCPPSRTFRVGALIVDAHGTTLATGHSLETGPATHAEESALSKVDSDDSRLPGATMYSSLEPCSSRASSPRSCTELILDAGIGRVVFAWREPAIFVDCEGAELLRAAGRTVVEVPALAGMVRAANTHLPGVRADDTP